MKNILYKIILTTSLTVALCSCSLDPVIDPNFPSVDAVSKNASKGQLNALATGQIAAARNSLATYHQVVGTLGKELFNFNGTESRWMTELNGLRPIDNSAFYNGATTGFGLPIRHANILLTSLNNTTSVTDQEKAAYRGLANTFKGLAYLYMLNVQFNNGVRLNVEDPFNPSKTVSYAESLAGIAAFLDEGASQLDAAGSTFPFAVPYAGFNTPATFKTFNRAVALRVAVYQKDWVKAETLLPQTFVSETASMNLGLYHSFNPNTPDIANPMLSTASQIIVGVEKIWDDIEVGDARKSKVLEVNPKLSYTSGVTYATKYRVNMYTLGNAPVPIIRNEELLLIAAEVAAQRNKPTDAVKFINIVRSAAGLGNYGGGQTTPALVDAILKERLYSLFYEGHRWIDMRRYDKFSEVHLPVAEMKILAQLERPVAEVNWDVANP
jgi:starch-binding outer membrane protein, SusD/RagB family